MEGVGSGAVMEDKGKEGVLISALKYPKLTFDLRGRLGNKKDNVTVIYTPWPNLHKNAGMAVGQVGFHEQKKVSLHFTCCKWFICPTFLAFFLLDLSTS